MGFFSSVGQGLANATLGTAKASYDAIKSGGSSVSDGLGSFGDMIPGIGDSRAADQQNKANIAAADRAMQFSERMSSTAYQRAMDDMKKAGLNPMLAFSQGGASAPQGVTPTINSTTKSKLGETAITAGLGIANTATARQQADTQQAIGESSVKLNTSTAAKNVADAERTKVETKKALKDLPVAEAQAKYTKKATDVVDKLIDSVTTSGKERSRAGDALNTFGNGLKYFFGKKQKPASKATPSKTGGF